MCGLVGVLSSDMTPEKVKIFQGLMVVATLRGTIGAGIAMVPANSKGKIEILRHETALAAELAHDSKFYKLACTKDAPRYSCLMGHARSPTSGGWDIEDTHPFVARHVIGMHNGHMKTVNDKVVTDKQNDSAVLFEAVGNIGLAETLKRSIGAFSIVMFNKNTKRLSFVRNVHRPMHFCMVDGDPKSLFWASEPYMLALVVGRMVNAKLHHYTLPPMELISFPVYDDNPIRWDDRELIRGGSVEEKEKETTHAVKLIEHKPDGSMYPTTAGHYFSRADLLTVLQAGCANCTQPATMIDYIRGGTAMTWFAFNEFMCDECLTHDQTARDYVTTHGVCLPDKYKTTAH